MHATPVNRPFSFDVAGNWEIWLCSNLKGGICHSLSRIDQAIRYE